MTQRTDDATERVQQEWTIGSYETLARAFLGLAARLVDAAGVGPGDRVLDVACGTGNVALTAHRRGADVTGADITPAMLEAARENAAVLDADVAWREADAAALPFDDGAFDVTLSCLGHMFVPDPEAAGAELVRVTRPGGRVAFAAWTPESSIAAVLGPLVEHLPQPPDSPPPVLWGDPDAVRDRLGDSVSGLGFETGVVMYPALSPAHFWASMVRDSGSIQLMLEELDRDAAAAVRETAVDALARYFSDADNAVEMEYRLVTGTVD